jgi:hypothetical protein
MSAWGVDPVAGMDLARLRCRRSVSGPRRGRWRRRQPGAGAGNTWALHSAGHTHTMQLDLCAVYPNVGGLCCSGVRWQGGLQCQTFGPLCSRGDSAAQGYGGRVAYMVKRQGHCAVGATLMCKGTVAGWPAHGWALVQWEIYCCARVWAAGWPAT